MLALREIRASMLRSATGHANHATKRAQKPSGWRHGMRAQLWGGPPAAVLASGGMVPCHAAESVIAMVQLPTSGCLAGPCSPCRRRCTSCYYRHTRFDYDARTRSWKCRPCKLEGCAQCVEKGGTVVRLLCSNCTVAAAVADARLHGCHERGLSRRCSVGA